MKNTSSFDSVRRPISQASQKGFTLVELLVVIFIMGILLFIVAPATGSLQTSNNLSSGGQAIGDQINVARQLAASRNLTVEVRFITPTTWSQQATPNYTGYHVMQIWAPNEYGTSAPVDRPVTLPQGIEISSNGTLSPLLSPSKYAASGTIATGATAGTYVSFYVRPNGNVISTAGTVPTPNIQYYYFTAIPVQADTNSSMPKNYVTLQLNPDTGRIQVFRP